MSASDEVVVNPFTPSFGRVPPILAGRKLLLGEMTRAFSSSGADPNLCTILIGTRGSGKTALLARLAEEAQSHGWISASVSAMPGMLEDIIERSVDAADQFVERSASARLKSLSIGQLLGVEWEYRDASSGNWRTRMNRLLNRLAEYDFTNARPNPYAYKLRRPVTMNLDTFAIDYFKREATALACPTSGSSTST